MQFSLIFAVAVMALWSQSAWADRLAAPPDASERSRVELLQKAQLDPHDPEALWKRLVTLVQDEPGCVDAWLPVLRDTESVRTPAVRLADAILRQLEEVGKPEQIENLLMWA